MNQRTKHIVKNRFQRLFLASLGFGLAFGITVCPPFGLSSNSVAQAQTITPVTVPATPDYSWVGPTNAGNTPNFNTGSAWTPSCPWSYSNMKYGTNPTDKSILVDSPQAYTFTGLVIDKSNDVYVTDHLVITTTGDHDSTTSITGDGTLNIVGGTIDLTRANTTSETNLRIGDSGVGTFNVQDGTFNQTNGSICVGYGNNGTGYMNVSGNSTVAINTHLIAGDNTASTKGIITVSGGTVSTTTAGGIYIGHNGTGEMYITDGTVTAGTNLYVGNAGTANGKLIQSGGTLNVQQGVLNVGQNVGAVGELTFTNGTINVNTTDIGHSGTGVLNMYGGTINSSLYFCIGNQNTGGSGTVNLYDGTISSNWVPLGHNGKGTVNQYGGTFLSKSTGNPQEVGSISNSFSIGDRATGDVTYNLYGGQLESNGYVLVGRVGNGELNISGGNVKAGENFGLGWLTGGSGTLNMTGGTITSKNTDIGWYGNGTGTQSGGDITTGYFCIGNTGTSQGEYTLSGGTITTNWLLLGYMGGTQGTLNMSGGKIIGTGNTDIGNQGKGIGIQSGGDITTGYFCVGNNANGNGEYTISGGSISASWMPIGHTNNAKGSFTQTGGTVTIRSATAYDNSPYSLLLGNEMATSEGSYTMSGGTLNLTGRADVGRNGIGTMAISGDAVINASNLGDQWFCVGANGGSNGTLTMSGGTLNVCDFAIAQNGTGLFELSGGQVNVTNWYLPAFSAGNGTTIQTGGDITTPWFITAWDNQAGVGTHEMYDGTLTVGANNTTSHNGRTGTGYINMYGGQSEFVNLTAGDNGGKGIFNFSGGDMTVKGYLSMKKESEINFIAGTKGFGSLEVQGDYTEADNAQVNVYLGDGDKADGLMFIEDYEKNVRDEDNKLTQGGSKIMTVAGTGTPRVHQEGTMYTTTFVDNALKIVMDETYGKGTLTAVSDSIYWAEDETSNYGWVYLDDLTGTDPFVMTLTFDHLDDQEAFLATLNEDLKVGQEQHWTATEGLADNQVIIDGLTPGSFSTNVFAWDFTNAAYNGVMLEGIQSQQVPEPATVVLLVLGLAGVLITNRRRRNPA